MTLFLNIMLFMHQLVQRLRYELQRFHLPVCPVKYSSTWVCYVYTNHEFLIISRISNYFTMNFSLSNQKSSKNQSKIFSYLMKNFNYQSCNFFSRWYCNTKYTAYPNPSPVQPRPQGNLPPRSEGQRNWPWHRLLVSVVPLAETKLS